MMIKPRLLFGEPAPLLLSRHTKNRDYGLKIKMSKRAQITKRRPWRSKKQREEAGGGVEWGGVGRTMKSCLFLLELCFEELSVKKNSPASTRPGTYQIGANPD